MAGNRAGAAGSRTNPLFVGGVLATASAIAFGLTTPFLQLLSRHAGAFTTAGLLYGGAALASLVSLGHSGDEAPFRARHTPRLVAVTLFGAVIAPACLAWALQRTQGTNASLMLNTEAVFTVVLARMLFREHIGARVGMAIVLMIAGGALLVGASTRGASASAWAALAVAAASLAWAIDNSLMRSLADLNPAHVVLVKAGLGAALSSLIGVATRESFPLVPEALGIAACGAIGYGASLRLYLAAQRRIGAGRTGSIFAVAPFVGAITALAVGERALTADACAAGALFAAAVYLHLTERHAHRHHHHAIEHEHAHCHDDGHHGHQHGVHVEGEHSHFHRHPAEEHSHSHGPDLHHQHVHDARG